MAEPSYSPGRELSEYPRPSLAVDIAAFTYTREVSQLMVLLIPSESGGYRLPGAFVREGERLPRAVERCLMSKAGVKGARATLLDIFDEPRRDPRGWVITAAHFMVIPESEAQRYDRARAAWFPIHAIPELQGDHRDIVDAALEKLRREYEIDQSRVKANPRAKATEKPRNIYAGHPDPEGFFTRAFTLRELQALHETVAGRVFLSPSMRSIRSPDFPNAINSIGVNYSAKPVPTSTLRDTFRRLMEPQLRLVGSNEGVIGSRGAPSRTWLVKD